MFCAYRREDAASRGLTAGFGMTEDLGKVRLKTSRGKQLLKPKPIDPGSTAYREDVSGCFFVTNDRLTTV